METDWRLGKQLYFETGEYDRKTKSNVSSLESKESKEKPESRRSNVQPCGGAAELVIRLGT